MFLGISDAGDKIKEAITDKMHLILKANISGIGFLRMHPIPTVAAAVRTKHFLHWHSVHIPPHFSSEFPTFSVPINVIFNIIRKNWKKPKNGSVMIISKTV